MNTVAPAIPRTRKPRGQGASRRGEILAAAKQLFAKDGFDHVTMRRIAEAVGVSATALYVYFPDKDAILQAIASESFTTLIAAHERAIDPARSTAENLRAGLRSYVDFGLAHPDEYRLIFLRYGKQEEFNPCKDVPEADLGFGMLLASVQSMIDEGQFPAKPAMLMAEAIWCCMHGLVALLLMHQDAMASDSSVLINQVIDVAIAGQRIQT